MADQLTSTVPRNSIVAHDHLCMLRVSLRDDNFRERVSFQRGGASRRGHRCDEVHKCISGGGKVLIPTFALGRAQELCILLDDYWERMNLKVPIYFSAGLTIQANMYYKMLIGWTSQRIKDSYSIHNTFDFKHVCPFDRSLITAPGPCVLFATPGMISGGFSLEVFKQWAPSEMNLVTLPGYCVAGTIGHKLMSGKPTRIDLDKDTRIDVRCQIHQLSFSPHTDGKGIMDLIRFLMPQHVILIHGEKPKMATLKVVKVGITKMFIRTSFSATPKFINTGVDGKSDSVSKDSAALPLIQIGDERTSEGILVMEKTKKAKVVHEDELLHTLGVEEHKVQFAYCCPMYVSTIEHIKGNELSGIISKPNGDTGVSCLLESNSPSLSLAEQEQTLMGTQLVTYMSLSEQGLSFQDREAQRGEIDGIFLLQLVIG
ncbi:hypothetical protein MRB53_008531 [Persea americana]|uniref:Uncharacterized protein n=1 Tax=Persea americana TaxID=3435 RepID=A0ACC2MN34_PERAE|nr:hypothetical protein MRB53_008531 [Persea americana]